MKCIWVSEKRSENHHISLSADKVCDDGAAVTFLNNANVCSNVDAFFILSPLLEERRSDSRVGRHHERHLAGHSRRVSRRYWGDELSACIEIHCMALSNNEDTIDQYVACLMVNCPEAIVQMPTVDQQLPVLLSSDDWQLKRLDLFWSPVVPVVCSVFTASTGICAVFSSFARLQCSVHCMCRRDCKHKWW